MIEGAKARPILFSGPMVRAIIKGRKTQTRRVVTPQPVETLPRSEQWTGLGARYPRGWAYRGKKGHECFAQGLEELLRAMVPFCPYGTAGALLYVRERMRVIEIRKARHMGGSDVEAVRVRYEADGAESDWIAWPERLRGTPVVGKCLAYGGFREASRTMLRNTGVRAERLWEISEEDAKAEGSPPYVAGHGPITEDDLRAEPGYWSPTMYRHGFEDLWDSINSHRPGCSWADNPFVWVVSFERLT